MLYAAYFTAIAILAGQRVKKVWVAPTKLFAWDPASLPISRPSAPLDILGDGATMIQVRQRETWANPQHDRGTSSPKLPPLMAPPPPVPPLPPKHVENPYPGQTYPGQKLRRGALPAIFFITDNKAQPDFPQDVSSLDLKTKSRPLTVISESDSSRYTATEPLKIKGHSKGAFSHDTGVARYAHMTRSASVRSRGDWMTPGFTYGREYVERDNSPQPSLPSSPRAGLPAHRRQPSINSYRVNPDGRYPNFF